MGAEYEDLYLKLGRTFGFGDVKEWGTPSEDVSFLQIQTPTDSNPDAFYQICLYVDLFSVEFGEPIVAGQVVELHGGTSVVIQDSSVFDFYDD